jgi:hypothetical protein
VSLFAQLLIRPGVAMTVQFSTGLGSDANGTSLLLQWSHAFAPPCKTPAR